jgi:hypothetical protein
MRYAIRSDLVPPRAAFSRTFFCFDIVDSLRCIVSVMPATHARFLHPHLKHQQADHATANMARTRYFSDPVGFKRQSGKRMLQRLEKLDRASNRWGNRLKAWAMKIARQRGIKKAIVALARRLAVIMHRIWVDGTEFRWTREQVAAAA